MLTKLANPAAAAAVTAVVCLPSDGAAVAVAVAVFKSFSDMALIVLSVCVLLVNMDFIWFLWNFYLYICVAIEIE